ncbi:MAG: Hsp33 family molecular chaperone HslO, partial [Spirochaetales bacterium]|nr:Hsp33 family molecular chaperone HslO [Spirochaetales bacterium]
MEKKQIYTNLRERLEAGKRDRMLHFILFDGTVRGALLHGTRLVNEMRANHELGILETLVLGHAYMGALLLSSNLKGD